MSVKTLLQSKGIRWIGLGWTAFTLENVVLSHNRTEIIDHFGSDTYHQVYNSLSAIACSSIAWGYFKHGRQQGPVMAVARRSLPILIVGTIVQTVGLVGLSQMAPKVQLPVAIKVGEDSSRTGSESVATAAQGTSSSSGKITYAARCPMDFKPPNIPQDGIYGTDRVSRYSMLWSLGMASIGNALSTIYYTEVVMFTFPLIFAAIGSSHQDYRYRRGMGGYLSPEKEEKTSVVPFRALLTGKQSWKDLSNEMKWSNAGLAAAYGLFLGARRILR